MAKTFLNSLSIYIKPKLIIILILGFASGIPLALTASTLSNWLARVGIDKSTIGLFSAIAIPYSLKFLWSPLLDSLTIPYFSKKLGFRKSWLLLTQILLIIAIICLGFSDPIQNIKFTAILAILVAFLSASQDIITDAYRIEILNKDLQAAASTMSAFGYRFAMFVSGGGSLFLSDFLDWQTIYLIMASTIGVGILTVLIMQEPEISKTKITKINHLENIKILLIVPFKEFSNRPNWLLILLFILLYKLPDAFLAPMSQPFYVQMGFTNTEIGMVVKTFGFFMTLFGLFIGGSIAYKYGLMKSLLWSAILQMLSNLFFILLVNAGPNIKLLYLVVAIENFTGALGNVIIIAYLSSLCNVAYTGTQYAILSSISSVGRAFLSTPSGYLVDYFGWVNFFIISSIIGIPGILVLMKLMKKKIYVQK